MPITLNNAGRAKFSKKEPASGDAGADQGLFADHLEGQAHQDRRALSHLGFQPVQKTPTIHVSSGFIWGIPVEWTPGA
jgi:hypothetical protein